MSDLRQISQARSATTLAWVGVGVLAVSLSGPLMAAATAVPALAMAFWRSGLGAVALIGPAIARKEELRRLSREQVRQCCLAGVMLAAHFATWVSSLTYTSVASATALVCLQVGWVVLLARLSGERPSSQVWAGLAVALVGVLVVSGVDFTISSRALLGDGLALLGGIFAAVYTITGGKAREGMSTTAYTSICYSTSAVVLLAGAALSGVRLWGYDARSWLLIVAVTVVAQLLGHSVFNHLLATISPTVVSLTLLLEVPGAALLAGVLLGQAPPTAVYGGLGLICLGLALVVRARSRAAESPREAPFD
ncbi:MAG: DMT family transporter [Nocardioidaceae bacterium]